jgi:uncharacterized OB-fold protein
MGTSREVLSMYDQPLWENIRAGKMCLQRCAHCATFRYPPAPVCAACLSMESEWVPIQGTGTILSWVVFHRKYFDDFEPPYNAIAVQLAEGPIIISNLAGAEPAGSWIGRAVEIHYATTSVRIVPQFKLAASAA